MDDARIPFRLADSASPLILLPVMVDDTGPYPFILDTGASHTLLAPRLATSLRIGADREGDAIAAGGRVTIAHGQARALALGALRREPMPVAITGELDRIGAAMNTQIDGALGYDFLGDLVLTLDYQSCALTVARSATGTHADVPFRLASPDTPLILVPVFANGRGPFQFVVDTGASRTCVSQHVATELGLVTSASGRGMGGGGALTVAPATLDTMSIGDETVHAHEIGVVTFLETLAARVGAALDGIVGYNFLSQFLLTIDYPRSLLGLTNPFTRAVA